jgi:hypothetical protein
MKTIVFKAKRTRLIVENYFLSKANTSDSKKIIFEAKGTGLIVGKKFLSEENL